MTIPRRRRWEVGDFFFNFKLNRLEGLARAFISLIVAGVVVIADTVVWVFTIFTLAGPMLVGGLHEALLDYRIVKTLPGIVGGPNRVQFLSYPERVKLMLVVLCGNLDLAVGDPQILLQERIALASNPFSRLSISQEPFDPSRWGTGTAGMRASHVSEEQWKDLERTQVQLRAILTCQYSFGSIVGAPVLFYLGSFFYTVILLENRKGDNSTAHSLAFGEWWMALPFVAIVSGCLLASNNPSTSTALVGKGAVFEKDTVEGSSLEPSHSTSSFAMSDHHITRHSSAISELRPGKTLPRWAQFGMTPVFPTRFRPVPMWERGQMKTSWLANSEVWDGKERTWLRNKIQLGRAAWITISSSAFLLILFPATIAFLISYNTPRKGLSCRSFTFVIYTSCQMVLIIDAAWRGREHAGSAASTNSFLLSQSHSYGTSPAHVLIRTVLAILRSLAFLGALFTGFAGTLMQILGVYGNCRCAIPVTKWLNPWGQTFLINPNSNEARQASDMWRAWGYVAIIFMAIVCYGGWWYQRFLRHKFLLQVENLDARKTDWA
ncbi:MAG: hypothetical protein M1828_005302 [Chrysothrix sp. TS-e1954]|nr:MAG: hypothetical protein M1828_005302 [Chrysothrix sp. TS-e1954]